MSFTSCVIYPNDSLYLYLFATYNVNCLFFGMYMYIDQDVSSCLNEQESRYNFYVDWKKKKVMIQMNYWYKKNSFFFFYIFNRSIIIIITKWYRWTYSVTEVCFIFIIFDWFMSILLFVWVIIKQNFFFLSSQSLTVEQLFVHILLLFLFFLFWLYYLFYLRWQKDVDTLKRVYKCERKTRVKVTNSQLCVCVCSIIKHIDICLFTARIVTFYRCHFL